MAVTVVPPSAPASQRQQPSSSHSNNKSIGSSSNHSSTSSFGGLSCITVRKDDDPSDDKAAGILLERNAKGQTVVTDIAGNGLFADSGLEIGDVILSVNKKKLNSEREKGPQVLWDEIVQQNKTISITVKKGGAAAASPKKHRGKKPGKSLLGGGGDSGRPPSKNNNNAVKVDTYYGGMAKHKADGSLSFPKTSEGDDDDDKGATTTKRTVVTISAAKPYVPSGTGGGRAKLPIRSVSKSPHYRENRDRKRMMPSPSSLSASTHRVGRTSIGNNKAVVVGLTLEVVDDELEVRAIDPASIFRSTDLRVGDRVLSVNDMSFRRYPDAGYATTIMEKARLMVTLVIERTGDEDDDDAESADNNRGRGSSYQSYGDSISSFGNISLDDTTDHDSKSFGSSFRSVGLPPEETDAAAIVFIRERLYRPVTISVPKSHRSLDAGVSFRLTKPIKDPENPRGGRKLRWVFVEDIDEEDSIFRGTSLEKGDRVLSINNTDLRLDPDPRAAYKACSSATEAIAMVVLKELTEEEEDGDGIDDDGRPSLREEMRCALDGSMKDLEWRC